MDKESQDAGHGDRNERADRSGNEARGSVEESWPRAEPLLAEIYRQRKEIEERGGTPRSVVMTMQEYRAVQRYHAQLGETPAPAFDYVDKYSILGLSVLIDNGRELTVLERAPE